MKHLSSAVLLALFTVSIQSATLDFQAPKEASQTEKIEARQDR